MNEDVKSNQPWKQNKSHRNHQGPKLINLIILTHVLEGLWISEGKSIKSWLLAGQ